MGLAFSDSPRTLGKCVGLRGGGASPQNGLGLHSAIFAFLQGHVLMPSSAPPTLQEGFCVSLSLNGQGLLTPSPMAYVPYEDKDQDSLSLTPSVRPGARWAGGTWV